MLKLMKVLGGSALMPALLLAASPLSAFGAQGQIEIEPASLRNAVMITRVTVGGVEVQCGQLSRSGGRVGSPAVQPVTPFEAGDDWPLATEIYLFNRTNKAIAAGRLDLAFLKTGIEAGAAALEMKNGGPVPIVHLDFGVMPANVFLSNGQPFPHRADERPILLPPGGTLAIRVADYAGKIKQALAESSGRAPARLFIIEGLFYFSDGMRWGHNLYSVPDAGHPGQWIREDPLYFPGDRENNWPAPGHRWGRGQ